MFYKHYRSFMNTNRANNEFCTSINDNRTIFFSLHYTFASENEKTMNL